jgi:hypothetical protein
MITTVTVSTVTSVTVMAAMGLTAAFSLSAGALLVVMLATKQMAMASGSGFSARLAKFSVIGITPLLIGFGIILAIRFFEVILARAAL